MSALTTLTRLIKETGPIKTFYISIKGAAYTELKIIQHEPRPYAQNIKHEVPKPKSILTNAIIGVEIYLDQDYKAEAARVANCEGRIQSPCIGKPSENDATAFLLRFAARLEYRKKHWALFDKFIKDTRKAWHEKRRNMPDPHAPDTLGWRVWHWDADLQRLISPALKTVWHTPELRVEEWSFSKAVRGVAGIHAARMPYDWRRASLEGTELSMFALNPISPFLPKSMTDTFHIVGIVERFGKYVLGTEGWRAEWVIIRALKAPSAEIGLALEQAYPDVEIYYDKK